MIDKTKTYRTRDGREVRIYATDAGGTYPIHGAYFDECWIAEAWTQDSRATPGVSHPYDLIEVKPRIRRTVWMNVYREHEVLWSTRQDADAANTGTRLACIPIEIDVEDKS